MKSRNLLSILLCVCALFTLFALPISAQTQPEEVSLLGVGRVSAPADSLTVRFEILAWSSKLKNAQAENERLLRDVIQALSDYGIPTRESYYSYEGISGTRFFVSSALALKTERIGDAAAICDILREHGVSAIFDVSYAVSDLSVYEEEALRLALTDAQQKADALGLTLQAAEIADMGCYTCGNTDGTPTVMLEYHVRVTYRFS